MIAAVEKEQESNKTELPDGWKWANLGDLSTVVRGSSPRPKDDPRYYGGRVPRLMVADVTRDGMYVTPSIDYLTDEGATLSRPMKKGDVVMVVSGAPGLPGILAIDACIHDGFVGFRDLDAGLLNSYLFFFLKFVNALTDAQAAGAIFRNLTTDQIKKIRIAVPPLPEQKRIVGILNDQVTAVKAARAATEEQLRAAKALPAAYLREVFESEEAQTWERRRLGDIAVTCSGTTPARERKEYYVGTIPWVKTGELQDCCIQDTEEHISDKALSETSLRLLPARTLLVAMYGQGKTRGRTGLLSVPATTNQACFAILPNPEVFDVQYLQWWFRHSYTRLRAETEGRGGNQPNLNGEVLRSQLVPLPPLSLQQVKAETLKASIETVDQACQSLQEQLAAINNLPATLLKQAFNGEL